MQVRSLQHLSPRILMRPWKRQNTLKCVFSTSQVFLVSSLAEKAKTSHKKTVALCELFKCYTIKYALFVLESQFPCVFTVSGLVSYSVGLNTSKNPNYTKSSHFFPLYAFLFLRCKWSQCSSDSRSALSLTSASIPNYWFDSTQAGKIFHINSQTKTWMRQ